MAHKKVYPFRAGAAGCWLPVHPWHLGPGTKLTCLQNDFGWIDLLVISPCSSFSRISVWVSQYVCNMMSSQTELGFQLQPLHCLRHIFLGLTFLLPTTRTMPLPISVRIILNGLGVTNLEEHLTHSRCSVSASVTHSRWSVNPSCL